MLENLELILLTIDETVRAITLYLFYNQHLASDWQRLHHGAGRHGGGGQSAHEGRGQTRGGYCSQFVVLSFCKQNNLHSFSIVLYWFKILLALSFVSSLFLSNHRRSATWASRRLWVSREISSSAHWPPAAPSEVRHAGRLKMKSGGIGVCQLTQLLKLPTRADDVNN